MNNENNNGMNMSNQNMTNNPNVGMGVNNTPINNQPTQGMGQPTNPNPITNNNTVYGAQQAPQYTSTQQTNMMNNQTANNNMNPNYYTQPTQNVNVPNNNKKPLDTKSLGLIIGIVALVAICAVLAIMLFTKEDNSNNSGNNNVNEYEENNNDTGVTEDDDEVASNTVEYAGFEFTKLPGYTYSSESDGLYVESNYYSIVLDILNVSFSQVKNNNFATQMKTSFEEEGMTVGAIGIENIAGKEVFIVELSYAGDNALYYITEADTNHVYHGMVLNYLNTFDHTGNMSKVFEIVSGAKYVGEYFSYTNTFDNKFDITKLK